MFGNLKWHWKEIVLLSGRKLTIKYLKPFKDCSDYMYRVSVECEWHMYDR